MPWPEAALVGSHDSTLSVGRPGRLGCGGSRKHRPGRGRGTLTGCVSRRHWGSKERISALPGTLTAPALMNRRPYLAVSSRSGQEALDKARPRAHPCLSTAAAPGSPPPSLCPLLFFLPHVLAAQGWLLEGTSGTHCQLASKKPKSLGREFPRLCPLVPWLKSI